MCLKTQDSFQPGKALAATVGRARVRPLGARDVRDVPVSLTEGAERTVSCGWASMREVTNQLQGAQAWGQVLLSSGRGQGQVHGGHAQAQCHLQF